MDKEEYYKLIYGPSEIFKKSAYFKKMTEGPKKVPECSYYKGDFFEIEDGVMTILPLNQKWGALK